VHTELYSEKQNGRNHLGGGGDNKMDFKRNNL
jgi:hypothetical protein